MPQRQNLMLSVVVPLFNEADGVSAFHASLIKMVDAATNGAYEIMYCDDGSRDATAERVAELCEKDQRVKLLSLSRNFGKENALAAGITAAKGQAILMLDGDGQHPVEAIPQFIAQWRQGVQVVIGCRNANNESWWRRKRSQLFYTLFNRLTGQRLMRNATDFRLIDREVQQAFLSLKETDRITRGLIDWLGFDRAFVTYNELPRLQGKPTYTSKQLMRLAAHSFVSLSPVPLYFFGYVGILITCFAFVLGCTVFIEQLILDDPLDWNFTGTAMLGILILFLVGILLIAQGMLSLYISHIHSQVKARPLFVVNSKKSRNITRSK